MIEGFVSGVISEKDSMLKRRLIFDELERKRNTNVNSVMAVVSTSYSEEIGFKLHKNIIDNLMSNSFPWLEKPKKNSLLPTSKKSFNLNSGLKPLPSREEAAIEYKKMIKENEQKRKKK